jgi:transposase
MDTREKKALEIAARLRIVRTDDVWSVPSQGVVGKAYRVTLGDVPSCDCDDFQLRQKACKHVLAATIVHDREQTGLPSLLPPVVPVKVQRPTYQQDWPNYNAAQVNERRHFQTLLADLCRTVPEPPRTPGRGRKPLPIADALFAAVFKVYSTLSARRFSGDLEEAQERGYIDCLPHFNSVLNVLENPLVTPILSDLIRRSALPLREIETEFAVDSSGFCTSRFTRWFDVKYGVMREKADWVKAHIACGVKTHVVTAVVILDKDAADVTQFPGLAKETAKGFDVKEFSADKAYAATECFEAVETIGATLYAPFKKNTTGAVGGLFEKSFHFFCLNREEFLKHYHKRSNVESVFSAVKRKFGDAVRSKTDTAMTNEVLAKFVCNNICCLISAWYELGIESSFVPRDDDDSPHILPINRFGCGLPFGGASL